MHTTLRWRSSVTQAQYLTDVGTSNYSTHVLQFQRNADTQARVTHVTPTEANSQGENIEPY